MNTRWLVGLGCLALCATPGWASTEPVAITASVDQSEVHIGEPIHYVIRLSHPKGLDVNWPQPGSAIEGFLVENAGSEPATLTGETVAEKRWWQLTIYSTGPHAIPAPVATYRDAGGSDQEVRGNAVTITVTSLLPEPWETLDIRDAKPLMRIRRYGWLWWLLGALSLAGAAVGCWWWRARRAVSTAPALPPRPPHEIALEALERLRQEALPSRGAYEEYYVRLSDIVRSYIEARFSLRAPEMTTEEFLQLASQGQPLSFDHRSLLQAFLAHCDMVKFARYQPTAGEADEAFNAARRFVQETIPTPEPEPAEHPGGQRAS